MIRFNNRWLYSAILISVLALGSCDSHKGEEASKGSGYNPVKELTEMSELGTVEYTITKNVKANDNKAFYKFGDRKIIFSCKAIMKAGIDLKDLTPNDIRIDGANNAVEVTLPKAKILSLNLPPEEAKIAFEKVGMFRGKFSAADRTALLQQGETAIMESVNNIGILQDAEANARQFVKALFAQAGYDNVTVNFK